MLKFSRHHTIQVFPSPTKLCRNTDFILFLRVPSYSRLHLPLHRCHPLPPTLSSSFT
uniref:Uncharacterized protein n=1 Tax=Manihot esculenta TaxID=3983 RepID=A0A251JFB3_MANES